MLKQPYEGGIITSFTDKGAEPEMLNKVRQ